MANDIDAEMESLEEEARGVLASPDFTAFERRQALKGLLSKYRVLADYRRALAAYIRRMRRWTETPAEDPEAVIGDILASPDFVGLQLAVFAALLAVVYGDGPRAAWAPLNLPVIPLPAPGLRL